jgi:hypothetical protein
MGFRQWLFGSRQSPGPDGSSPTNEHREDEIWDKLRFLRAAKRDILKGFTAEEKIEMLARLVANLVDEVELLKGVVRKKSGMEHGDFSKELNGDRMWLLYSGAGGMPPCISKFQPFLRTAEESAKMLIPDDVVRASVINHLESLT